MANWYVDSSIAVGAGTGTLASPGNLKNALAGTAWATAIAPGDTISLRGGTYVPPSPDQGWLVSIAGSSTAPITVRAYNGPWFGEGVLGERVSLAGFSGTEVISGAIGGAQTWMIYRDIEVYNSNKNANDPAANYKSGIKVGDGTNPGTGNKIINCFIHDIFGNGINNQSKDANEIHGNLNYYNGLNQSPNAHGVYISAISPASWLIKNNILHSGQGLGIQAFGPNEDNVTVRQNIVFNEGASTTVGVNSQNILVSSPAANNPVFDSNYTYYSSLPPSAIANNSLGDAFSSVVNPTVTGNYFAHGISGATALIVGGLSGTIVIGGAGALANTFYGAISGFTCNQYGANTCVASNPTSGTVTAVFKNDYEIGRANIVIFNWGGLSSVPVTLPSGILNVGDTFAIRDAQNFYGVPTVATTTYTGDAISIPMTGVAGVATPIGLGTVTPPNTQPIFGAFILQRIRSASRAVQVDWTELEAPSAPTRAVQVDWTELEAPSAPTRAVQVDWTELEAPSVPRAAQVDWVEVEAPLSAAVQVDWTELEAPSAPSRVQVSWSELEVPSPPSGTPSGAVGRLGDQISHGGTITSAGTSLWADGIRVARLGDSAQCVIHGGVTITSGSPTLTSDSAQVARVGDTCSCGATITEGSQQFIAG